MRKFLLFLTILMLIGHFLVGAAEPLIASKALSSGTCMTSGCHGGAGLDRGAYTIWKRYDPHVDASATLTNGRSKAMARELGIENAAESKSCTICHSPMSLVVPAGATVDKVDRGVSCANCHGSAENWLLSHTRRDYPKDALARLGMRPLASAYQRANNCVACHQNLSDALVTAKHPALVFELDGMLVAEPKHWREDKNFSSTQTWLVGQAVALREAAAQAVREPNQRRSAEIEAIQALLKSTGTGWNDPGQDLVRAADEYAKRISAAPMSHEQSRVILSKLLTDRTSFHPDAFNMIDQEYRLWSVGYYAERLALAIDRLNQTTANAGDQRVIAQALVNELFDAAKPPESFDRATVEEFVDILNRVAEPQSSLKQGN